MNICRYLVYVHRLQKVPKERRSPWNILYYYTMQSVVSNSTPPPSSPPANQLNDLRWRNLRNCLNMVLSSMGWVESRVGFDLFTSGPGYSYILPSCSHLGLLSIHKTVKSSLTIFQPFLENLRVALFLCFSDFYSFHLHLWLLNLARDTLTYGGNRWVHMSESIELGFSKLGVRSYSSSFIGITGFFHGTFLSGIHFSS